MLTNVTNEITLCLFDDLFYNQNYDLSNMSMVPHIFIDQSEPYLSAFMEIVVKLWFL